MDGYMIAPLDLTERQVLIYMCLYKKCNFKSMQVDMTISQMSQSITIVDLSEKVVYLEIQKMIKNGYISMVKKGTKGISPIYKIEKVGKLMGSQSEVNGKLNPSNCNKFGDTVGSDREVNGKELGSTIQRKRKGNNIYIDSFTKIFDIWNDENIIVHRKITDGMLKAYKKSLDNYKDDEIVEAIKNYSKVLNSDFYYSYKFSLEKFLSQGNGISRFVKDGDLYINYLEQKKTPTAIGGYGNNKLNYNQSICNDGKKYSYGREIL